MHDVDQREIFSVYLLPGNQKNRKVGIVLNRTSTVLSKYVLLFFSFLFFIFKLFLSSFLIGRPGFQKGYSFCC